uniref:Uncharacterized protein n=1 Tax=Ciona savignyi TaxID=51511 RepID=H2ZFB9_CIOSA
MGKTGKVQTKPVSAFAVYSTGTTANNAKRERVESASSLQERPAEPTFYPIIDQDRSKPSSSLIKNISNKFSLGRAASKRKTKQKKPVKDKLSLNAEPQWNPVELNNSQIPMVNFSSEPVNFGLQSKNQLTKTKLLFKKDASIELSTSQSLSSCDDEPVQTEEKKIEKSESFAVTHTLGPDTHPPPRKRLRVVKAEDEMVVCDPGNDDQLHGSGENIKERTPKKAIKPSSSLSSSCTTISKKASSVPKMPFPDGDSEKDGKVLFDWLILPYTADKFFENIWEKKPFCLSRHIPNYADGLFSSKELNRILKECNVRYSVNLDVTTYQNGCRETHNIEGRAFAPVV